MESPPRGPGPDSQVRRAGLGLRISLYLLACLLVLQIGTAALLTLIDPAGFEEARARGDLEPLGLGVLLAIQAALAPVVIVLTIAFLHFFDRLRPAAIGAVWPRPRSRVLLGVLAAPAIIWGGWLVSTSLLADLSFGSPGLTGRVQPDSGAPLGAIVLFGLGFVCAAAAEEWMLRGYVFSALRARVAWIHAAGATAALQLLLQWTPQAEAASLTNIFLLALGLGALRELTGSVWPGILFHGTWNLVLGSVVSLPVSSFEAPRLFDVALEGDRAWTGGSYGPEASWSLTSFLLVALVLLVAPLAERDARDREAEPATSRSEGEDDG